MPMIFDRVSMTTLLSVGVEGFEPPTTCSQSRRASATPHSVGEDEERRSVSFPLLGGSTSHSRCEPATPDRVHGCPWN